MAKEKVKITKEKIKLVKKLSKKLLSLMGTKAIAKVSEDKRNEAIRVDIDAKDETGLLIGRRGDTIFSLQAALGMMVRQETDSWVRIIVDVGDWREKQESQLKDLATQAAERARETGESQPLYNLNAAQRRIIHLTLSEEEDIKTESQGEGQERCLVVESKK